MRWSRLRKVKVTKQKDPGKRGWAPEIIPLYRKAYDKELPGRLKAKTVLKNIDNDIKEAVTTRAQCNTIYERHFSKDPGSAEAKKAREDALYFNSRIIGLNNLKIALEKALFKKP